MIWGGGRSRAAAFIFLQFRKGLGGVLSAMLVLRSVDGLRTWRLSPFLLQGGRQAFAGHRAFFW